MINQILEDEDTEYQTESFESNCFGPPIRVKAIRTAGSTADYGNFGYLID